MHGTLTNGSSRSVYARDYYCAMTTVIRPVAADRQLTLAMHRQRMQIVLLCNHVALELLEAVG